MPDKQKNKKLEFIKIWSPLLVIIFWLLNLATVLYFGNFKESGVFGDTFGAVNALFSGLAFAGLIYAILLQQEELSLQRNELRLTREEFSSQNKTLAKQRFENTFFNMLSLHNEIVDAVKTISAFSSNSIAGRDCFLSFYEVLLRQWNIRDNPNYRRADSLKLETPEDIYAYIYKKNLSKKIGHYFRNLYRIFVFIDESDIEDKNFYAKIIRAQLSDHELLILFYNCFYFELGKNFQQYAIKYEIFDNIQKDKLLHPSHFDVLSKEPDPRLCGDDG